MENTSPVRRSRWNPYSFKKDFSVACADMRDCVIKRQAIINAARTAGIRIVTRIDGNTVFVWLIKKKT